METVLRLDKHSFESKYRSYLIIVNDYLQHRFLCPKEPKEHRLYEAMQYSLMAGGKRIRPILSLSVAEMLGGNTQEILPYACAIESIHTSALIHDDLIDNDGIRRGQPANHVKYGKTTALLAGDALLNYAYEFLIGHLLREERIDRTKMHVVELIMSSTGLNGMMGGQMMDCSAEQVRTDLKMLQEIHRLKTGSLIKATVLSAAWLSSAPPHYFDLLEQFSDTIGLAFQVKDDILNKIGNPHKMGKSVGGDAANFKSTFVSMYGLEKASDVLDRLTDQAIQILDRFEKEDTNFLKHLVLYIKERER